MFNELMDRLQDLKDRNYFFRRNMETGLGRRKRDSQSLQSVGRNFGTTQEQ